MYGSCVGTSIVPTAYVVGSIVPPVVDDEDLVRVANSRQAVGDDNDGAPGREAGQGQVDVPLGSGISHNLQLGFSLGFNVPKYTKSGAAVGCGVDK